MLLWALAALSAGAALLLAVPLELWFEVRRQDSWRADLRVRWFFGLVQFPLTAKKREGATARAKEPKVRSKHPASRLWRVVFRARFRTRLIRFVRRASKALRPRSLWLRLRIGLEDPAETGMLWGAVGPALALAPPVARARLDVAPQFGAPVFDLEARGKVRVIPIQLGWIAASFALSPMTAGVVWSEWRRG